MRVHVTAFLLVLCLETQKYNVARQYNANEEGFKEMYTLSVSVFPCPSETVCAHTFCMGRCGCTVLTYCCVLTSN